MIETKENPRWVALLKGDIHHTHFKFVAAAMMVSRCQRELALDASHQGIKKSLDQLHTFFTKYENLVKDDLNAIFG